MITLAAIPPDLKTSGQTQPTAGAVTGAPGFASIFQAATAASGPQDRPESQPSQTQPDHLSPETIQHSPEQPATGQGLAAAGPFSPMGLPESQATSPPVSPVTPQMGTTQSAAGHSGGTAGIIGENSTSLSAYFSWQGLHPGLLSDTDGRVSALPDGAVISVSVDSFQFSRAKGEQPSALSQLAAMAGKTIVTTTRDNGPPLAAQQTTPGDGRLMNVLQQLTDLKTPEVGLGDKPQGWHGSMAQQAFIPVTGEQLPADLGFSATLTGQPASPAASSTLQSTMTVHHPSSPYQDEAVLQQIADRFHLQSQERTTRLNIKLQPAELGKLDINLVMKEGSIRAHVVVQSGQVQEILEKNMNKLKSILAEKGVAIEEFVVSTRNEAIDQPFFPEELPLNSHQHIATSSQISDISFASSLRHSPPPDRNDVAGVNIMA
ncbi:MAG: flagellar hook-length control protein FliK [Desulfopila sp.]